MLKNKIFAKLGILSLVLSLILVFVGQTKTEELNKLKEEKQKILINSAGSFFIFRQLAAAGFLKKVDDSLTNDYYDYIVVVATQRTNDTK